MELIGKLQNLFSHASPEFRRRLIYTFGFLFTFNIFIWVYALFFTKNYPILLGLITLAYGLGLRHAVDADHIAAIDNSTRKLMQDGKRPVGVGFFFSLGHSTIVILLSILVAFSANFIKNNLPALKSTGALIGTSVSGFFLLMIGLINLIVLIDIFKIWKRVSNGGTYDEDEIQNYLNNRGFLAKFFKPLLKAIGNSWNMYFIGFLFGLGFDTASEVGILSISAATGMNGIPVLDLLILPLAFTAGMALIDTIDGILMLGAYGWAYIKPIRKLYYNMNITFISVVIALFIGGVESLQVVSSQLNFSGPFFIFINKLDFGNLGYIIIAIFVISWIISISIYKIGSYDRLGNTLKENRQKNRKIEKRSNTKRGKHEKSF